MAKRNMREEVNLGKQLNTQANDLLDAEGKLDSTYKDRQNLLDDINDKQY